MSSRTYYKVAVQSPTTGTWIDWWQGYATGEEAAAEARKRGTVFKCTTKVIKVHETDYQLFNNNNNDEESDDEN